MEQQKGCTVAIAGWGGLAGSELLNQLLSTTVQPDRVVLLGGGSSDEPLPPGTEQRPLESSLADLDLLYLALPPLPALRVGRRALRAGIATVDLSGALPDTPCIIPALNAGDLPAAARTVATPNCISVLLALGLAGLHRVAGVTEIVTTVFQSVSGAGRSALDQLHGEQRGEAVEPGLGGQIHGNLLPFIGPVEGDSGMTTEEGDLARQLPQLLGSPELKVEACCTRVPVERGHSFSVTCRVQQPLSLAAAAAALGEPDWVEVSEPGRVPLAVVGSRQVHIGRLRPTGILAPGFSFWLTGDQLLLGAAMNALALGELLRARR